MTGDIKVYIMKHDVRAVSKSEVHTANSQQFGFRFIVLKPYNTPNIFIYTQNTENRPDW
jgi:hypothetical protein